MKLIENAVKRAKCTFDKMMQKNAISPCSMQLLECREMVNRDYIQLNSSIMEAMAETARLVDKLKSDTKLPKSLREISDIIVNHGVLFVDFDGRIIFTNPYANNLLCANACDLSRRKVLGFLVDGVNYDIVDLVDSGLGTKDNILPVIGNGGILMETCCSNDIELQEYDLNIQILNKYPMSENEVTFIVIIK